MVIIETLVFTKQVQNLLSAEEYRSLQTELVSHPNSGAIIPGSGGIRKIRWSLKEQGKRSGVRVIYYWAVSQDQVIMLYMFKKNVQEDLTIQHLKPRQKNLWVNFGSGKFPSV